LEQFEVEGTSLVSWTIRVQAHNEREAVERAERIAGWIDLPYSVVTVKAAQHRITRSGPTPISESGLAPDPGGDGA
jgi:hypothetical protein